MSDSEEFDVARLRQGLYRFFAASFLPPTVERLEQLESAADLLEDLGVDTFAFAQPWRDLRNSLSARPAFEKLEGQYVHLFESGTDGALCPPTESFYVSKPRLGGPAVVSADLEVEFHRLGLVFVGRSELGVDHISSQLELMALLCAKEATSGECGDLDSVGVWNREQRQFTDAHLSQWVPHFVVRVCDSAPFGYFRDLTAALDAFVDHDRELLHVLERLEHAVPSA